MGGLPRKLQSVKIPPMVRFDHDLVPGGRGISWVFLVISGAFVGLAAGIMGVGGGFLTFPIFVYTLGVSSMTTVGTDIFQIIFTAGWSAITQYAIYGFIFYTLAMGMLLGSLLGIQIGAMATKVVPGITIRGFYAMSVLAGFVNRIFALPSKLSDVGVISLSKEVGLDAGDDRDLRLLHRHHDLLRLGHRDISLEHSGAPRKGGEIMIARKKEFSLGLGLLVAFFVVLFIFFSPVFNGT